MYCFISLNLYVKRYYVIIISINCSTTHSNINTYQHLFYSLLQGPALYAYNDAEFNEEDWRGIRMLSQSIKHADPLKVGYFGLGFKSVFHLTGRYLFKCIWRWICVLSWMEIDCSVQMNGLTDLKFIYLVVVTKLASFDHYL